MTHRQERSDAGFSLIEMMTAMAIATSVLGLVTGSLINMLKSNASTTTRLANLDQVRQSMDAITKNLRTAVRPEQLNPNCATACSEPFVSATATSVRFYANVGAVDSAGNPAPTLTTYSIAADPADPTGKTAAITEVRQNVATSWTSSVGDYTWAGGTGANPCPTTGTVVAGCTTRVIGTGITWPIPTGAAPVFAYWSGVTAVPTTPTITGSALGQLNSVAIALPVGDATHSSAGVNTTVFLPNSSLGQ
jgi:prepilin-type N-terminal cleavage/methylation domain-containing protein